MLLAGCEIDSTDIPPSSLATLHLAIPLGAQSIARPRAQLYPPSSTILSWTPGTLSPQTASCFVLRSSLAIILVWGRFHPRLLVQIFHLISLEGKIGARFTAKASVVDSDWPRVPINQIHRRFLKLLLRST